MGALFDINHALRGPAAMIGIPSLCVAAVLVTRALARYPGIEAPPRWSAHLPWISVCLMLAALAAFSSALQAAGVDMSAQTSALSELPAGVSGYVGWANRLLFVSTYVWAALAARAVLRAGTQSGADARLWTGRLLSGGAALFFIIDGVMKLLKPPVVVESTIQLGYPESAI